MEQSNHETVNHLPRTAPASNSISVIKGKGVAAAFQLEAEFAPLLIVVADLVHGGGIVFYH